MNLRRVFWRCSMLAFGFVLLATDAATAQQSTSALRVWGVARTPQDEALLRVFARLEEDYRRLHPDVVFVHPRSGDDSALGGLSVGAADLSVMEREPSYTELDGYQQVITGLKPVEVSLMRGGVKAPEHSSPLVVVGNRHNPMTQIAFSRLSALFHGSTPSEVKGYGFPVDSAEAQTFSEMVMGGSRRWACGYVALNSPAEVIAAVERDPDAVGLMTLASVTSAVKVLAVANAGVAYLPTVEALRSGDYPLGRDVRVLTRSDKEGAVDPKVQQFLEYLKSPAAQAIIAADEAYVPAVDQKRRPAR